jgi:hypothetical protein
MVESRVESFLHATRLKTPHLRPSDPAKDNRRGIFVDESCRPSGRRRSSNRHQTDSESQQVAAYDQFRVLDRNSCPVVAFLLAVGQDDLGSGAEILLENPGLAEEIYDVALSLKGPAARQELLRRLHFLISGALQLLSLVNDQNGRMLVSDRDRQAILETTVLLKQYERRSMVV